MTYQAGAVDWGVGGELRERDREMWGGGGEGGGGGGGGVVFFFNDTATTEIYTLSLHDALPIFLSKLASLPTYNSLIKIHR